MAPGSARVIGANLEAAIATLRTPMSGDDINAIRQRSRNLTEAMTRLTETISAVGSAARAAGPPGHRQPRKAAGTTLSTPNSKMWMTALAALPQRVDDHIGSTPYRMEILR